MKRKKRNSDVMKFGVQGFARVNITEDGKLVGDSGWVKNTIVSYGLDNALAQRILGGSVYGSYAALGTGGAPATNTTALPGENTQTSLARDGCSTTTSTSASAAAVTARWYGTFDSNVHVTNTLAIANIGIYASSATNASNLLCGATYTVSTLNTNQAVNYTYEWQFNTTT